MKHPYGLIHNQAPLWSNSLTNSCTNTRKSNLKATELRAWNSTTEIISIQPQTSNLKPQTQDKTHMEF